MRKVQCRSCAVTEHLGGEDVDVADKGEGDREFRGSVVRGFESFALKEWRNEMARRYDRWSGSVPCTKCLCNIYRNGILDCQSIFPDDIFFIPPIMALVS